MKKCVIGLSGGLDSATLLSYLLAEQYEVHCCSFYYGSKHGELERNAAREIYEFNAQNQIHVVLHEFDLTQVFVDFKSALMQGQGSIPEGHYRAENMRQTVVPGRNMIFASIMAGLAESIGAEYVALGTHSGDHHIYPDCRPSFNKALHQAIQESSDNKVSILTPFEHASKGEIINLGKRLDTPYELTRTCYTDSPLACGRCGSCVERLEAFAYNNIKDPITYQNY